jgi:hypothetical protein
MNAAIAGARRAAIHHMMIEVLRVWKSWAISCEIDDDLLMVMSSDVERIC